MYCRACDREISEEQQAWYEKEDDVSNIRKHLEIVNYNARIIRNSCGLFLFVPHTYKFAKELDLNVNIL